MAKNGTTSDNGVAVIPGHVVNFSQMFEQAMELFAEQALLTKGAKSAKLADIELTKAKADSFLNAVSNLISISHQMDLVAEEKNRFQRKDELHLLNTLREICTKQAEAAKKTMDLISDKLEKCYEDPKSFRAEDVVMFHNLLEASIDSTQKIIASSSRLIQLERNSGSRPWGRAGGSSMPIGYISGLDDNNQLGDAPVQKPRRLSADDIINDPIGGKDTSERYR